MAASRTPASGGRAAAVPPAALWRALLALAALNLAAVLRAASVHGRWSAADPYWDDAPRLHGDGIPPVDAGADDDDAPVRREETPASGARDPPAVVCLSGRGTAVACGPGRREPGPDAAGSLPPPPGGDEDEDGATVPSRSRRRRGGPAAARARSPPNPPVPAPSDDGAECVTAAAYQERGPPSTCNDVHGLAFVGSDLHDVSYLTSGGFRSVFVVDFLGGEGGEETAIVKTHRMGKDFSEKYLGKSQLDVLILGEAGGGADAGSPDDDGDQSGRGGSNVLSVWQYCAFTSVSPYATSGTLADYVGEYGGDLTPAEMYDLSLQAARGLARSHLHRPDGVATFAHADVKPPQFLLFDRGDGRTPEVRLNDFNRGRLLGYDPGRRRACPFRLCGVKHNGSTYRSPEEYMSCADQDDRIDVYALGGVIYFIVTGGLRPWHYTSFKRATGRILDGETSAYPGDEGYGGDDDDTHGRSGGRGGKGRGGGERRPVVPPDGRLGHPAVRTLREVVARCWAYRPGDRPSSLEVVRMLEDGLESFR